MSNVSFRRYGIEVAAAGTAEEGEGGWRKKV